MASVLEEHYGQYDGFVVCHGTDTMAYTAATLSYLIQDSRKPIVVTGAQKPIDLEVTVTKLMWILGQTKEPARVRELFYRTVGRDMLYTSRV